MHLRFRCDVLLSRTIVLLTCFLVVTAVGWADPCPAPPALPEDQDPGDGSINACSSLSFIVPPVPAEQQKNFGNGGWGWLVLTFDRPIEGGSFIFLPDCPDPLDGVLNPADHKTIRLGPGNYGIGPTGHASESGAGHFGTFDVTILYDEGRGNRHSPLLSSYLVTGSQRAWTLFLSRKGRG